MTFKTATVKMRTGWVELRGSNRKVPIPPPVDKWDRHRAEAEEYCGECRGYISEGNPCWQYVENNIEYVLCLACACDWSE